jgi:peptidoglycan/LPS O-acetylase OafA/YrhL
VTNPYEASTLSPDGPKPLISERVVEAAVTVDDHALATTVSGASFVGEPSDGKGQRIGSKHNLALDGLRLIAFLLVYVSHTIDGLPSELAPNLPIDIGDIGVQIFYVLSGFLIGGILLDLRADDSIPLATKLKTFYARRALRIFPAYYLFLGIIALPPPLHLEYVGPRNLLPWELFYLTNIKIFLMRDWPGSQSHLWSLAVEEQFYLIAPLIMLTIPKRLIAPGFVVVWIGCAIARVQALISGSDYASVLTPMQFDCLTLGIAAALIQKDGAFLGLKLRGATRLGWVFGVAALPVLLLGASSEDWCEWLSAALGQWVFCAAVASLVLNLWNGRGGPVNWLLSCRPFAYLGQISYGLYLYHNACLEAFENDFLEDHPILGAVVGLGVTIVVAALSWQFFERPLNQLKRYFPYRAPEPLMNVRKN